MSTPNNNAGKGLNTMKEWLVAMEEWGSREKRRRRQQRKEEKEGKWKRGEERRGLSVQMCTIFTRKEDLGPSTQ